MYLDEPHGDDPYEKGAGLLPQLGMMIRALMTSAVRNTLFLLGGLIFLVIVATAYGQIRLNRWNQPFYDALAHRDFHGFMMQLGVFGVIAGGLLILNVIQRWLAEMLKLKLRQGLVQDLVNEWLRPHRAYRLNKVGPVGVNPDQRMHEDARKLCELSSDLGAGLLLASIMFVSFAGILWRLSRDFVFRVGDTDYGVPGFMVWAAVLYALLGSLVSYWVGGSLINRNSDRYAREADLRFSLVRVNEHLDGISLAGGEPDERRRIDLHIDNVLKATRRIVTGLTNLTWVTAGFGWITLVAPILVAAPVYFAGKISFGGLMMAAQAFTQAQTSLRWFVDNFSQIADWRATLLRVASFRYALTHAEELQEFDSRINYADGEPGTITINNLRIVSSAGWDLLKERNVVVRAGERVLVVGAPGTGKTLLFRALAGLWPWGAGDIGQPKNESIVYLPRGTPYLPRGTLREVMAYPSKVENFATDAFSTALARLGLEHLESQLDVTVRWDRELSQDEQVSLAFARIVLQRPAWVLVDDTFGSLDDATLERVTDVFANELANTGLINVGRAAQARDPFFSQVLHLVKSAGKA